MKNDSENTYRNIQENFSLFLMKNQKNLNCTKRRRNKKINKKSNAPIYNDKKKVIGKPLIETINKIIEINPEDKENQRMKKE